MNLKNKFILKFSIGFSLGILICVTITSIITTYTINDGNTYIFDFELTNFFGNELIAFIVQLIISGFFGAICIGGTIVYDIESWSILKATMSHFIITVVIFFITAFLLRWWLMTDYKIDLIILAIFIIIYLFIWIAQYIKYKIQIKKIQNDVKKFRQKSKRNIK